jgi:hypothetical protein
MHYSYLWRSSHPMKLVFCMDLWKGIKWIELNWIDNTLQNSSGFTKSIIPFKCGKTSYLSNKPIHETYFKQWNNPYEICKHLVLYTETYTHSTHNVHAHECRSLMKISQVIILQLVVMVTIDKMWGKLMLFHMSRR